MGRKREKMKGNDRSDKNGERSKIRSMPEKTVKIRYIMYHVLSHLLSQSDLLLSETMHLLCNYAVIV